MVHVDVYYMVALVCHFDSKFHNPRLLSDRTFTTFWADNFYNKKEACAQGIP
eukprot:m.206052 g.206052  ORF g.206052 m.206052 type:complete len:52 (+) comp18888_c0_seq2:1697-1852(+)